jgi:hypothetical protein
MQQYFSVGKASVYLKFFMTLLLYLSVKEPGSIGSFAKLPIAMKYSPFYMEAEYGRKADDSPQRVQG